MSDYQTPDDPRRAVAEALGDVPCHLWEMAEEIIGNSRPEAQTRVLTALEWLIERGLAREHHGTEGRDKGKTRYVRTGPEAIRDWLAAKPRQKGESDE